MVHVLWEEAEWKEGRQCMSVIPSPRRQRQENLCEFEPSLVSRVSTRTARGLHRETLAILEGAEY